MEETPAEVKAEPGLPSGAIVRSKEDIERERREREEAEKQKAPVIPPMPAPSDSLLFTL